jgi:Fic family protein
MKTLSFKLTQKQILRLQDLDNKIVDLYGLLKNLSEEELSAIHKFARVSMIGASTRIENALLTDLEIDWLDTILSTSAHTTAFESHKLMIEDKLSKDRERSIEEVAGCRQMLLLIYQEAKDLMPLRETDVRSLHHELLAPYRKALPYAGHYKTQPNSVIQQNWQTGEKKIVFQTADAGPLTQVAMAELLEWYNGIYVEDLRTVPISAEFIFRFLAIHPFQDGNGRLGRGLFLLLLLQSQNKALSNIAKYLAIDRYIEKHKEEYYFILRRCSDGKFQQDPRVYKINYFLDFMVKILQESLNGIETYRKKFHSLQKLSETAGTVLSVFKEHPEMRLNTKKISEETSFPERTVVYALSTLLKNKLIQKYGQGRATKYQLTF